MKTKLKTLNDFPHDDDYEHIITQKQLRAEAVKWIKAKRDLIDFFNLDKEDLRK